MRNFDTMRNQPFLRLTFIALILAIPISIYNYYNSGDGKSIHDLAQIYAIDFMFTFVITGVNSWYYSYLERFFPWSTKPVLRLVTGAVGSVVLTMVAIFALVGVITMGFYDRSWDEFISGQKSGNYVFGLIVTFIITVCFHAVYFYKELSATKVREQRVIATTANAQFDALKNQLDPHFLFNSLNVLVSLIEENPDAAVTFTTSLSKVYRYVLEQRDKALVSVDEELDFARTYIGLLKMRFEDSIVVTIPQKSAYPDAMVVPLSLQLLIENAVKHNVVSSTKPLQLRIYESDGMLFIENNLQVKDVVKKSSGVGLNNIASRYALLTDKKMTFEITNTHYNVRLPLINNNTLLNPQPMKTLTAPVEELKIAAARERVEAIKDLYKAAIKIAFVIPMLAILNYFTSDFPWVIFPAIGMSLSLFFQYLKTYGDAFFLGKKWEANRIKELMNDKNF